MCLPIWEFVCVFIVFLLLWITFRLRSVRRPIEVSKRRLMSMTWCLRRLASCGNTLCHPPLLFPATEFQMHAVRTVIHVRGRIIILTRFSFYKKPIYKKLGASKSKFSRKKILIWTFLSKYLALSPPLSFL